MLSLGRICILGAVLVSSISWCAAAADRNPLRSLPVVKWSPPSSSTSMVLHRHSGKELDTQAIIRETRHQLNARLHDVLSGKRARDFGKQQRLSSDVDLAFTPPIISTHGRYPLVANNHTKHVLQKSVISVLQEIELEDALREPSLLILAIRALRLSINFAPCTCSSGLALVSTTFRNKIWYKMLAKCLARSGPAFIKWGEISNILVSLFLLFILNHSSSNQIDLFLILYLYSQVNGPVHDKTCSQMNFAKSSLYCTHQPQPILGPLHSGRLNKPWAFHTDRFWKFLSPLIPSHLLPEALLKSIGQFSSQT